MIKMTYEIKGSDTNLSVVTEDEVTNQEFGIMLRVADYIHQAQLAIIRESKHYDVLVEKSKQFAEKKEE